MNHTSPKESSNKLLQSTEDIANHDPFYFIMMIPCFGLVAAPACIQQFSTHFIYIPYEISPQGVRGDVGGSICPNDDNHAPLLGDSNFLFEVITSGCY
ncbi:hypothetical protein CDAR_608101 [Caerostris darwini]|uniref:Uncharacterized protein n=1 Tax=Caerostris darwini TaxID=1538125 RepID=A0AAV4Q339_9ARAC|nr:hypothetical protein CDAR_608101 [Caerostris darwini]